MKKLIPRKEGGVVKVGPTATSFGRQVVIINPDESDDYKNRLGRTRFHKFVLSFEFGTNLMVYAYSLDDALEECGEYLAKHAPGLITPLFGDEMNDLLRDACKDAGIDFADFDSLEDEKKWDLQDKATADMSYTESGYISEWAVALEDPTRTELLEFCYPKDIKWSAEDGLQEAA